MNFSDINNNEMILVCPIHYDEIIQREEWLQALEEAGVDNWEGIEIAIKIFKKMHKQKYK